MALWLRREACTDISFNPLPVLSSFSDSCAYILRRLDVLFLLRFVYNCGREAKHRQLGLCTDAKLLHFSCK